MKSVEPHKRSRWSLQSKYSLPCNQKTLVKLVEQKVVWIKLASSVIEGETWAIVDCNCSSFTVSDMLKSKSSNRSKSSGESFSSNCNTDI